MMRKWKQALNERSLSNIFVISAYTDRENLRQSPHYWGLNRID